MMVDMGTADPTLDKYVGCKPQCTKASLLCIILIRVKMQVKQKKQPHVFSSLKILKIRIFLCLLNFLRVMFSFLGDAAVYAHVH